MARLLREQCQSKTGAPTKRNSKSISSSKASWGGAPTQRNATSISTNNASWGGAPTKRPFQKKVNEQRELGWLRRHPRKAKPFNTKYCENREQQQDIFKLKISYCCFSEMYVPDPFCAFIIMLYFFNFDKQITSSDGITICHSDLLNYTIEWCLYCCFHFHSFSY